MEKLKKVMDFIQGSPNLQVFIDIIVLFTLLFLCTKILFGLYNLIAKHIFNATQLKCFVIVCFIGISYAYFRSKGFGMSVPIAILSASMVALFAIGYLADIPFWRNLIITPLFMACAGGLFYGATTLLDKGIEDRWTIARQFKLVEDTVAGAANPDTPAAKIRAIFKSALESIAFLKDSSEQDLLKGQLDAGLSVLANSRAIATNQMLMMENINTYAQIEEQGGLYPESDGVLTMQDFQLALTELRELKKEKENSAPPDVGDAAEYLWENMTPTGKAANVYSLANNLAKVSVNFAMAKTNGSLDAATKELAEIGMAQLMAITSGGGQTNTGVANILGPMAATAPQVDVGALIALASGIKPPERVGPAAEPAPESPASVGVGLLMAAKTNSPVSKYASLTSKMLSEEKVKPAPTVVANDRRVMDLAAAMALMSGVPREKVQGGKGVLLAANKLDSVAALASPISQALSLSIQPDYRPTQKDLLNLRRIQTSVAATMPKPAAASTLAAAPTSPDAPKKVAFRKPVYLKTPKAFKINGVISSGGKGGYVLCNGNVVRIGSSVPLKLTNGVTEMWKLESIENNQPGWSKSVGGGSATTIIRLGQGTAETAAP